MIQSSDYQDDYFDADDQSISLTNSIHAFAYPAPAAGATPAIKYGITTSSTSRPSLTAQQLQAIRDRQIAVVANEPKKIKIGTLSAIYTQLHQKVIYDAQSHKGISFDEFAKQFPDQIENFMQQSQVASIIEYSHQIDMYNDIEQTDDMRNLEQYEIVGELPCVKDQEQLFYPEVACNKFSRLIKNYINTNFAQVHAKCISVGLVPTISQEVWSPCKDCDAQFHRSCYKQCYQNALRFCCAAYCPGAIDRSSTRVGNWTDNSYKQNLKRPPVVVSDKIKDDNCPVCFQSLLPKAITIGLAAAATERPEIQMTTRSGRSYAQGLAGAQETLEINSVGSSTKLKRKRIKRGAGASEILAEVLGHTHE